MQIYNQQNRFGWLIWWRVCQDNRDSWYITKVPAAVLLYSKTRMELSPNSEPSPVILKEWKSKTRGDSASVLFLSWMTSDVTLSPGILGVVAKVVSHLRRESKLLMFLEGWCLFSGCEMSEEIRNALELLRVIKKRSYDLLLMVLGISPIMPVFLTQRHLQHVGVSSNTIPKIWFLSRTLELFLRTLHARS